MWRAAAPSCPQPFGFVRIMAKHETLAMAHEDPTLPPDDWLQSSGATSTELPRNVALATDLVLPVDAASDVSPAAAAVTKNDPTPAVAVPAAGTALDDAFRQAEALAPLDRLRLAARLWTCLLPVHRAALVHFQWERFDVADRLEGQSSLLESDVTAKPTLWHLLFDRTDTTGLYSAPRRFDLATIFVVTGAYSVLLGVMSILNFAPAAKIIIGLVLAFVAVAQSLYHGQANPRGVSVVAGSIGYALMSFVLWLIGPMWFPNSFFFAVVINGLLVGALLGYVAGVLVGGMFLAADMLRTKAWTRRDDTLAARPGAAAAEAGDSGASAVVPHSPTHS